MKILSNTIQRLRLLSLVALLVAWPAWATFPAIDSVSHGTDTTSDGNYNVTLPTITSGDLVICYIYHSGGNATWPNSGPDDIWTEFGSQSGEGQVEWAWHVGTGSEGSTTTPTTGGGASTNTYGCWALSGAKAPATTPPEFVSTQVDGTDSPDPPSITPTWGCDDNFYIVMAGERNGPGTWTGYPTSYINTGTQDSGIPSSAYADRMVQSTTENPDTFTLSATENWLAVTVAVRPDVAGTCTTGVTVQRRQHD